MRPGYLSTRRSGKAPVPAPPQRGGRGEVVRYQDVETRPDVRRQGLAGTVVYRAGLHAMRQAGVRVLVIVADPAGPAIGLCLSMGFPETEGQVGFTRPLPLA